MRVWDFLKETFSEWSEDRAPRMGAALAYYTVFSLAPVLVIAIGVAGIFFGQRMAEGRLMHEIRNLVGPEGAGAIRAMIANAAADRPGGMVATMMGVAALVVGATGAFVELQDALNTIWKVQPRPRGLLRMLKDRFLSFTLVVGIGFLLLVSLVISAALAALGSVTARYVSPSLLHGVNFLVSFGVITVLFAMIFKILPDAKIAWRDVWLGAAVASLLFSAGKFIIGLYLGKSGMASAYGAAGSLVIVRRVVHPHENDHQGAGRTIGGSHAALAQVETDDELTGGEEQRGDGGTQPHVAPRDLRVGQDLEDHREQHRDDAEGDQEIHAVEQRGRHVPSGDRAQGSQGCADHQRHQQQEPDPHDEGEREEAVLQHTKEPTGPGLDLPDGVQGILELDERPGRAEDQGGHTHHRGDHPTRAIGCRVGDHRPDRSGTLGPDQVADLVHQAALGHALTEEDSGHPDGDHQHRGERENRVVRKGGAHPGRSVLTPLAERLLEKVPDAHRCTLDSGSARATPSDDRHAPLVAFL